MASVRQQTNRPMSSGMMSRAVLAVVLAFGFWAWVTNNSDPDRSRPFDNIPVTIVNQPAGLAVTDYSPTTVTVMIWGPRSVVNDPNLQAGNFGATINLKEVRPGTLQAPIEVNTTTKNLRKTRAEPATAQVHIEQSIEKALPVTVSAPTQAGVTVNSANATPAEAKVTGPESRVSAVTQLVVQIDIGDRTANFQSLVDVKALDANNRDVSGVTISPPRVMVAVELTDLRNERVVPVVTPDVTGSAAPGFRLDSFNVAPSQVTLVGDPQALRTVANIPTQPIPIDGLNTSKIIDVPLDTSKLPPGVTIKNGVTSVRVQVNIAEITQDIQFTVGVQPVNLRPGLQASLSQRDVLVTLRGTTQELSQINGTNLLAIANLASFTGPGTNSVSVDVQLPANSPVKVVKIEPQPIQVTVTALPTPTPVPSPTPRPTPVPTATPTA